MKKTPQRAVAGTLLLGSMLVACSSTDEAANDDAAVNSAVDDSEVAEATIDASAELRVDSTPDVPPEDPPWVRTFGDAYSDLAMAVAADSAGVLLGGMYNGVIDFGDGALTESTPGAGFLAAFDSAGDLSWAVGLGDGSDVKAAASCPGGDRIVAGTFKGKLAWGTRTLDAAGGTDLFVARVAPDQTLHWLVALSGAGSVDVGGLACAFDEAAIVAGSFLETVNLGMGDVTAAGQRDVFVARFDKSGAVGWTRTFGGVEYEAAAAVAVDEDGRIVLAGRFADQLQVGSELLTAADRSDIFIASLAAADGTPRWARRYGEGSVDEATDVAVDASGQAYLTGWFSQQVLFDGKVIDSAGGTDVLIAAFDADGSERWARSIGAAEYDRGRNIAVDAQGRPYLAAIFAGTIEVGAETLTSSGQGDLLVAFDADGNVRWAHALAADDRLTVDGLIVFGNDGYLAGNVRGKAELGFSAIESNGSFYDLFLLRFGLSGSGLSGS